MTTIDRPIPHWSFIVDACQVNVRQAPQYAAVSNIGDTSPHYLQPPPIVEIRQVRDLATGNRRLPSEANGDHDDGLLLMHVALIDSITNCQVPCYYPIIHHTNTTNNGTTNQQFATETQPSLTGCLVSPAYKVNAEAGARVKVFVFPEVRVWVCGVFRLEFTLFERCGQTMQPCHVSFSPAFTVLSKEAYPGPIAPTRLSLTLATQGIRQRVYKQPLVRKRKTLIVSSRNESLEDNVTTTATAIIDVLPPLKTSPPADGEAVPPRPVHRKIQARGAAAGGDNRDKTTARQRYASSTPASRVLQPNTLKTRQSDSQGRAKFKSLSETEAAQGATVNHAISSSGSTSSAGDSKDAGRRGSAAIPSVAAKIALEYSEPQTKQPGRRQGQVQPVTTNGDSLGASPTSRCHLALLSANDPHKEDGELSARDLTEDEDENGEESVSLSVTVRPRDDGMSEGSVGRTQSALVRKVVVPSPAQGHGGKMSLCNLLL